MQSWKRLLLNKITLKKIYISTLCTWSRTICIFHADQMFSVRIHIFARLRDTCPALHWVIQSTRRSQGRDFLVCWVWRARRDLQKQDQKGHLLLYSSSAPWLHTFWVFYSKEDQYFRGENSRHSTNHYKRSILTFRGTGSRWSFRCLPTQTILFPVVKLGFMVLWFIFSIPQNPVIFCRKTELNFSLITE